MTIMINKPHSFLFWKNMIGFFCKKRSWIAEHILIDMLCCMIGIILYHLSNQLFKMTWSEQKFYAFLLPLCFFFKTYWTFWILKNIHAFQSDTCPMSTIRWYKTVLNHAEWTCKVKKKPLIIAQHCTPKSI